MSSHHISFFSFLSLFFIISLSLVSAIGISPPSQEVTFESGTDYNLTFKLTGLSNDVELSAQGALEDFISFPENVIDYAGPSNYFSVIVTFPEYDQLTSFGEQKSYIKARELPPEGGTLAATTAVNPTIKTYIPEPGLYAEIEEFSIETVSEGQNASFDLSIRNRGTEPFSSQSVTVTILDLEGEVLDSIVVSDVSASPGEVFTTSKEIASGDFKPGKYTATASFDLDESRNPFSASTSFFVGSTDIVLLNHTSVLTTNMINKVDLTFQSLWGSSLEGVRVYYTDVNGKQQSLPSIDFESFEEKTVTAFMDLPRMNKTIFTSNLTLEFPEGFSSTPSKTIPLEFEVRQKKDSDVKSGFSFSEGTAVTSVVILGFLILAFIVWFNTRKKSKK
ncbi:MAG: hypothetical protein ACQESC_00240 [Nanobdellota archaeon]